MDRAKIIKMVFLLAAITVIASGLIRVMQRNSLSLAEYEEQNKSLSQNVPSDSMPTADKSSGHSNEDDTGGSIPGTPESSTTDADEYISSLIGATLNGDSQKEGRVTYSNGFYYEPLSEHLFRYIRGISFPSDEMLPNGNSEESEMPLPDLTTEDLRYVHIWYFDFNGNPSEGELICNEYIAQDLVEIFHTLYRNEYQLGSVRLVDEFDADAIAAAEANNSYCFNSCEADGKAFEQTGHSYGLAVNINPYYNPNIAYREDGSPEIIPSDSIDYADRTRSFAYKIDENDLCYKTFTAHGFLWGGNWNSRKEYGHFYKSKP